MPTMTITETSVITELCSTGAAGSGLTHGHYDGGNPRRRLSRDEHRSEKRGGEPPPSPGGGGGGGDAGGGSGDDDYGPRHGSRSRKPLEGSSGARGATLFAKELYGSFVARKDAGVFILCVLEVVDVSRISGLARAGRSLGSPGRAAWSLNGLAR